MTENPNQIGPIGDSANEQKKTTQFEIESDEPEKGSLDTSKDFVVGVTLVSGGHARDYYWNQVSLKVGDLCIVKEEAGLFFGSVTLARRKQMGKCCNKQSLGTILRKADERDIEKAEANEKKEKAALGFCRERIYERDLSMSLSRVSYHYDGKKAIFYFTAENRVDFRELVKDLSTFTRVKVEIRQIGVRDEAKLLGGCGPCGQELCCWMFLTDFAPVSIRMAKDQFLSLSPEKISGVCGRLMCCLAYEHPTYKELLKNAPKMGKTVETPDGKTGKVTQINALTETINISFEDGGKSEYGLVEIDKSGKPTNIAFEKKETVERKSPSRGVMDHVFPGLTTDDKEPEKRDEEEIPAKKRKRRRSRKRPKGKPTDADRGKTQESRGESAPKSGKQKPDKQRQAQRKPAGQPTQSRNQESLDKTNTKPEGESKRREARSQRRTSGQRTRMTRKGHRTGESTGGDNSES